VLNSLPIGQAVAEIKQFIDFLKMAVVRHLEIICVAPGLDYLRRVFGGLYQCVKFDRNQHSSFDNM